MDEAKNEENINAVNTTFTLPAFDDETRKKINLAIYHDGLEVTTVYVNNILDKFRTYFNKVFLVSEDDSSLENLNYYENLSVVGTLKPISLKSEWLLLLNPGEFPSLQFLNNLSKILNEVPADVKIVKFPLVVCHFRNGEIIDVLPASSRLYRQNPQILQNSGNEEITLEDYPIIKLYVDFSELDESGT
jgi:hypothetical protein